MMPKVHLINIRHGKDKQSHIVFATLVDAATGIVTFNATLDYLLAIIKERGYVLVGDPK